MITTRGWGAPGGIVTTQGYGGFFVVAFTKNRGFSGDFLELFIDLRHKQRIKQSVTALHTRVAAKDVRLTSVLSMLGGIEHQLRDLEMLVQAPLSTLVDAKINATDLHAQYDTKSLELLAASSTLEDLEQQLRELQMQARLLLRQRRIT